MADTASPALPPFYTKVVVNPNLHGALRLNRAAGHGFAAGAASIPVGLGEFGLVARHYPIVFAAGPVPVALVGINELGNLFVDGAGAWRADAYVPAYVRAFPFVFVEDLARSTTYVGMDEGAACLGVETGERLFEDDKPTTVLSEAVQFCAGLRHNVSAATAFAMALDAAGLLEEEEAKVRGFKVIWPDRLDQVDDATFPDWRRRGWLGAIYAHLHSAGNWARLIDLAVGQAKTR